MKFYKKIDPEIDLLYKNRFLDLKKLEKTWRGGRGALTLIRSGGAYWYHFLYKNRFLDLKKLEN